MFLHLFSSGSRGVSASGSVGVFASGSRGVYTPLGKHPARQTTPPPNPKTATAAATGMPSCLYSGLCSFDTAVLTGRSLYYDGDWE